MIKSGNAWHFKKYSKDEKYAEAEVYAQTKRLGLWSEENTPLAPWDYRKLKKKKSNEEYNPPPPVSEGKGYWINKGSNTRHNPSCDNYGNTKRGYFTDDEEGKACKQCKS